MTDLINNRYRVIRLLGQGGMGAVYLVEDTLQENQLVTLKKIRADLLGPAGRNLAQFKYEFAALAQLRHPNLIAVYDFGVVADTQEYFYTMEYVPGQDLPNWIAGHIPSPATPPADYTWLYEITVQVCRVLQYIHSRGFIHYDVKPHNIRITPEGQIKLMDFGLIGEARGEGQLMVRGTPEYIAPELIRGDPADHCVDLYSLGVSLYEIVAGRLPFVDTSSMTIIRQHVETPPEPPRRFDQHIPEPLQAIILKLLEKEPVNRYASANQVIHAINEISGLNFPVETKETKRCYIQSGRLVGREAELAHLQGQLMRMILGQGQLVLITGAAGVGKTRLVRELRRCAQMQHVLVCEGVCYEHARSPYRPWVSILSQVISYQLLRDPESLRLYGASLIKLMPELAAPLGSIASPEKNASKPALMEDVAGFLTACNLPLVLVLEDLHYADAETIELLDYLGQRAGEGRLLLCGAYRDDEVSETHPLNLLRLKGASPMDDYAPDIIHIDLLTEQDAVEMIKSMLGVQEVPADLPSHLMAETGGNPLFIESVMHNLADDDLLHYDGKTWRIDIGDLLHIPSNIQEAAQRRLKRVAEHAESLQLLQWAAIMGHWLDMESLAEVGHLAPERVFHLVGEAVRQHILAISGQAAYRFSTDAMREAVYQTVPPDELARRHRQIGQTLRELYGEGPVAGELAWHFERAGDLAQALHYSTLAANRAQQVHANETAIRYYSNALAFVRGQTGPGNMQTEYELLAGRERCYNLIGERGAQRADLEAMARIAQELGDVSKQVKVATRHVAMANELGNHADARRAAEAALNLSRQAGHRKLEADSLTALGQACYRLSDYETAQASHQHALELYRQLEDQAGQAASLRSLGNTAYAVGKQAEATHYYEQSLELYRNVGDQSGMAGALNNLGALSSDFAQKRQYFEQALAIRQATGDRSRQAQTYNNLAMIYCTLGLYGKAREYLEQAVQITQEQQGRSGLTIYLEGLGRVYLELGEYTQAQDVLEKGCALAQETGNRWMESVYWMMLGRAALAQGQLNEAREFIQIACDMQRASGTVGHLTTSLAWLGATHLALGEWEEAYRYTSEAIANLNAIGNVSDYPPQDVWWLHYQVLKADPNRVWREGLDDETWTCLQHAYDAMMGVITTLSDEGLRRNYLNKVKTNRDIVTEWTRQSARRAHQQARLLNVPEAASAEPEHLHSKLKRVLDISVRMNEIHDAESLLNYVMDQMIELSGAERGILVLMDRAGQMDFKVACGIAVDEIERTKAQISYTVLGTVAQSRSPLLLQDALADERFGRQSSVLELNLRSVLCVPLLSRSELIGMIYADNRSVSGRFSQADVDLMVIFANQAAAAIENTRLYQETIRANKELEAWARTLEQRVVERTAELSRRAMQLEISSRVGQQITSILDLDDLLKRVVTMIQAWFGYYFVGIWLLPLSGKKDFIALRAGVGPAGEGLLGSDSYIPVNAASIIVGVCKTGTARLVNDVQQASDYMPTQTLPNTRSELALPLRRGEVIVGVLDIQSDRKNVFSLDDQVALQTLADQIAIAIHNAQLYKAEQTRRWLAESLERTGRELTSSLDLHEVPGRILEQLAAVVPYERGAVMLQHDDALQIIAQHGFPQDERVTELRIPIREGDIFQQVVSTCQPVMLDDVIKSSAWQQMDWLPLDNSWLGVPLISRDQVIGMISLTRREAGAFGPDDAMLVSAFAAQAVIALQNASLYDEISRFSELLEQMVFERTEELNKAYQTLESLNKTKSDFINVAAHELRTPLTAIRGGAQVLSAKLAATSDSETDLLLEIILTGADRLYEIVNSMLDVTRLDSQTLNIHRAHVGLSHIIERLRTEFLAALQERQLTLTVENLSGLPSVHADAELLFKVFYHLIINAIKYTPDGGSITVSGVVVSEGEVAPAVEVTVSDTGIGIDPAHHDLIFEKFYQTGRVSLHSSGRTKFKGGGPGLGLAIAKGIVVAHGGKIWVESPGCDEQNCPGSHFHIRLPIA